ncbi:hypothetical protein [Candidatus Methanoperedens nitratireducens]|nr:hypothetical protein [Candidatus Methanoperedens nitroreducens]
MKHTKKNWKRGRIELPGFNLIVQVENLLLLFGPGFDDDEQNHVYP